MSPTFDKPLSDGFASVPGYMDTASVGLPARAATKALRARLEGWETGQDRPDSFDPDIERARVAFAHIVGTDLASVGVVSQVSVVSGLVASSLPDSAVVLCAEEDFTSVLFPFFADDRLRVRAVPLDKLLDSIDDDVDLVAVSAVQSADGRVVDLDELSLRAERIGARTYVDTTQGAGWLPIQADRFDVTACHAYKWLCSPRGAGFLTVSKDAKTWLVPNYAGWFAGEDPWTSIYRPPLRLAADARRFNASPAWFSYAAAAPTLEILADLGPRAIGEHDVGLANLLRVSLGLDPSNTAIVSLETPYAAELRDAGITAATRAGRVRMSFHLYNTTADVEMAVRILRTI
ncbi:aminotransferase class V-fold PLP-dependent enzyme [soil metagenome]